MNRRNARRVILSAAVGVAGINLASFASAQTVYWDTNDSTAGSSGGGLATGNWDGVNLFWNTDSGGGAGTFSADPGTGNTGVFSAGTNATGAYTVTVSGTQNANGLTFEEGAVTLSGGQVDLASTATVDVATGLTARIDSVVGGSSGLTKTGLGRLVLGNSTANTYTGGTNINVGALQFATANSMPISGAVSVASGATLAINADGTNEWTGATSGGGSIGGLIAGVGGQGTADQVAWTAGSTFEIDTTNAAGGALTYSGVIGSFRASSGTTDNVGVTKTGTGILTLSGNNTFSGPLSIADNAGTIILAGTNANAGTSLAIPKFFVGSATTVRFATANALPATTLVEFNSGNPQFRLYDGASVTENNTNAFSQTVRGFTGANGSVQVGQNATLTIDVPDGESYAYTGTLRTDFLDSTTHGRVVKTGLGRQDWNQIHGSFNGEFILQQGTVGIGNNQIFGPSSSTTARLTIEGGTLKNIVDANNNMAVRDVRIAGSFSMEIFANRTTAFVGNGGNATVTLDATNPTITVVPGTTGTLNFNCAVKNDATANDRGFTKAGAGILVLGGGGSDYRGETTIQEGALRITKQVLANNLVAPTLGDGTGRVNLSGGTLDFNGGKLTADTVRTTTIANPIRTTADSTIAYASTTAGFTDITDPAGVVMEFTNSSVDQTGGTLTFRHNGTSQGIKFRPIFSANGINYGGPVVIDNGGGTRRTWLESTNVGGTQTWGGDITGTGTYIRAAGGTTVLGGETISVNSTNSGSIIFDRATDSTYSGIMTGGGTVTKQGAGTLTLSGANTYSGGTTVSAGTLKGTTTSLQGAIANNAAVVFDQATDGTYAGVMSGAGSLTKEGAGNVTMSAANTRTGATTVNAGTLTATQGIKTVNALTVADGAKAVVPEAATFPAGDNATYSKVSSLNLNATGQLDLNNSDMAIDHDGSLSASTIAALVASGYNGGTWDGPGIISTSALADTTVYGLGYAENGDSNAIPDPYNDSDNPFFGIPVDNTTVLIKFTWIGDLNLDGFVNFSDLLTFNGTYDDGATTGRFWWEGDFDYDGTVSFSDLLLFNGAYDENKPSLPEPGGVGALILSALGVSRRTRRRSRPAI